MQNLKLHIMRDTVVIDYQLRGWAKNSEEKIKQTYKNIKYVGEPPNPPSDASDSTIALHCRENKCDMLTSDKSAYTTWLDNYNDVVRISIFARDEKTIYTVQRT